MRRRLYVKRIPVILRRNRNILLQISTVKAQLHRFHRLWRILRMTTLPVTKKWILLILAHTSTYLQGPRRKLRRSASGEIQHSML
ncbi:hypothetical protein OESDEN_15288 [Oesophagostomum dentatum]|uniref:Uncharacterized protein n=1 Tax=Oesophagostomum dentatum TaxID=61180 RepID=A0A0B1SM78_OESDE|nr:hypothetical protein OESDEN_15288 [Oesophagostomum dentatum]